MWITTLATLARRGLEHPAYALTHHLYLSLPGLRGVPGRIGCISADYAQAVAALSEGALVLVYPEATTKPVSRGGTGTASTSPDARGSSGWRSEARCPWCRWWLTALSTPW